jgi:hypothetical protein
MTLILGVHMATKTFLISDTRLTRQMSDGSFKYEDTINKSFSLNKRMSGIAAGHVQLAAFVLKKLREKISEDSFMMDLERTINENANDIIKEFVNTTMMTNQFTAIIFAGFDYGRGKKIGAAMLGNVMSAELASRGNGSRMNQAVHTKIKDALAESLIKRGTLGKDSFIDVDLPKSRMLSLKIGTRQYADGNFYELKEVECYNYISFYPDKEFKSVVLPNTLLTSIEFPESETVSPEEDAFVYSDSIKLINFVRKVVRENNFVNVGGNIFPLIVLPEGSIFPTGDIAVMEDGKPKIIGGIHSVDNVLCYTLPDGTKGQFQTIEGLDKNPSAAQLQI